MPVDARVGVHESERGLVPVGHGDRNLRRGRAREAHGARAGSELQDVAADDDRTGAIIFAAAAPVGECSLGGRAHDHTRQPVREHVLVVALPQLYRRAPVHLEQRRHREHHPRRGAARRGKLS